MTEETGLYIIKYNLCIQNTEKYNIKDKRNEAGTDSESAWKD